MSELLHQPPLTEGEDPDLRAALDRISALFTQGIRWTDLRGHVQAALQRWPDDRRLRHWDHVLAPGIARTIARPPVRDPRPDYEWLKAHRHEHPGCWIAVYEGELVCADPDPEVVLSALRRRGLEFEVPLWPQGPAAADDGQ
jgi:hypothetical protein